MSLFERPYVVSWNLTYRCNLACEHCYLDAGGSPQVSDGAFADRGELNTDECYKVIDDIVAFAPEALTILTGGEPLLRRDILQIVRRAVERELWVVIGTNGVSITEVLAGRLRDEGVRGLALSLDALDAGVHDEFRRVQGAWHNTVRGAKVLHETGLPFIVQTTVGRHNLDSIARIADFAHDELGAKVWNLYFLVQTGRGQFVSDISPAEYDGVLAELSTIQQRYQGRMVVNAKCAPHYVKHLFETDPASPFIRTYTGGAGGCPAGTHYLGIRPNGDVTPCPYLPVTAGNLRGEALAEVWNESEPFRRLRGREDLGGRCGSCEFQSRCGGCRARAWGVTGDDMAEDPLCSYEPGRHAGSPLLEVEAPVEYGAAGALTIEWDADAESRMKRVPAFVRGMVVKRVEGWCREQGVDPRHRRASRPHPREDADAEDLRKIGREERRPAMKRVPKGENPARRFYDRLSRVYDLIADHDEHAAREKVEELLAVREGERVLEVGFGTGHGLDAFARAVGSSGHVDGVDISPGMVAVAGERLAAAGLTGRVSARVAEIPPLPYDDASFDVVSFSFTLELFPLKKVPVILDEVRRVLRPGGRLGVVGMISTRADEEHPNVMTRTYKWFHRHFPHIVDCRPVDIAGLLAASGFQVDQEAQLKIWTLKVGAYVAIPEALPEER